MNRGSGRRNRRQGFALVGTVLLIGIAGLLLTGFASLSVNKSIRVQRETHDLQKKWGVASVQRLAFSEINELLTEQYFDSQSGQPVRRWIPSVTERFELGAVEIELLIADESAKLDLNMALAKKGDVKELIGRFVPSDSASIDLQPKLRRRDSKDNDFVSWDQVFVNQNGSIEPVELIRLTQQLTCWGKKTNLSSASDDVLFQACKLAVGAATAQRVVDIRQDLPESSVNEILAALNVSGPQGRKLKDVLSRASISQSIWIKATHHRSGSESYWYVIREGFITQDTGRASTYRYQAFRW